MTTPVTPISAQFEQYAHKRFMERAEKLIADVEATAAAMRETLARLDYADVDPSTSRSSIAADMLSRLHGDMPNYGFELLFRVASEADMLAFRRLGGEEGWNEGRESIAADLVRARGGDGTPPTPTPNPYAKPLTPEGLGDLDARVLTFLQAYPERRLVPHGVLRTWPRDVVGLRRGLEGGGSLDEAVANGLNVYAIVREVGEAHETDLSETIGRERRALLEDMGDRYGKPLAP